MVPPVLVMADFKVSMQQQRREHDAGSAVEAAGGVAEQARRSHVALPARGRAARGRGGRGAGMKLSKLGASKLPSNPDFFDF